MSPNRYQRRQTGNLKVKEAILVKTRRFQPMFRAAVATTAWLRTGIELDTMRDLSKLGPHPLTSHACPICRIRKTALFDEFFWDGIVGQLHGGMPRKDLRVTVPKTKNG